MRDEPATGHYTTLRGTTRELRRATGAPGSTEMAPFLKIACAILLDEHEEARFLAETLATEHMRHLEAWPIWALHLGSAT